MDGGFPLHSLRDAACTLPLGRSRRTEAMPGAFRAAPKNPDAPMNPKRPSRATTGGSTIPGASLFNQTGSHRPLAARMRPATLDEFVGQEHLLGPGKPLRESIEQGTV